MLVCMISDMHGNLNFNVPEADLLLVAGDSLPYRGGGKELGSLYQERFIIDKFNPWLEKQPVKEVIIVAGNHCWIFEIAPDMVPKFPSNVHYIEDKSIEILGLKIYGTPVQLPFYDWAFNREETKIQKHWDNIPEGIDILLLHSPPYGILDTVNYGNFTKNIGSISLKKRIEEIRPKIVVFGHNHNNQGIVEENGIKYINASLLDDNYIMTKKPIIIEF